MDCIIQILQNKWGFFKFIPLNLYSLSLLQVCLKVSIAISISKNSSVMCLNKLFFINQSYRLSISFINKEVLLFIK